MTTLCIEKAIQLFHLLDPFIPKEDNLQPVEIISKIVYNIKASNQHRVYLEVLALMQETDIQTIIDSYSPEQSIIEFTIGLQENQILALREFCNKVGI